MTESGFVEVPGGKLYYEVDGEGPPLTLIHAGVAHLRMWEEQVKAWRDRFRVIRYDTRGFGRTRVDDVPYSNREDLLLLLDHLGVGRTALVGLSRGGTIALDFTLEYPDRVSALVLVAAGVSGFQGDDDGVDWDAIEKLWTEKRWDELVEAETRLWVDGRDQPPDRVEPSVRSRMLEWNAENYAANQSVEQAQPLDPPAAGRLAEVRVPTLVAWGDLDLPSMPAAGELAAREIPGARRHVFGGVAHMVNLERPEEFNGLVGDFLATPSRQE